MMRTIVSVVFLSGLVAAASQCGGSVSTDADAAAGDSGGTPCSPACGDSRLCCNGVCINAVNDPKNCGMCGVQCSGATPFCDGSCKAPPCSVDGGTCAGGASCCGASCCTSGQLCCQTEGPISQGPQCFTPTPSQATCPPGCAPQCKSDRNIKRDITLVDQRQVLESVAQMPVSTWSYKADDPSVRHMGPMAQDFQAAFQLGNTDRAYDPIDAHGVAFASIQALYEMVQDQNRRIERLERENTDLRQVCGATTPTQLTLKHP